jgi:hypothetical protein
VGVAGLTLVDWDGFLANPAVEVSVRPPLGARFPVSVELSSDEPRLYFDLASRSARSLPTSKAPPSITYTFESDLPSIFHLAIWPDRDGANESHVLTLEGGGVTTEVPVHVIDQDLATAVSYPVTVDFSHDALLPDGTRFFDDPARRSIAVQAAEDWAYFFDGSGLDDVRAGSETTTVDGAQGWYGARPTVRNASDYRGFLLYATGVQTSEVRSTGYPSTSATFESHSGVPLEGNLHRSGALEVESRGNYTTKGWIASTSDSDWHDSDNIGGATDLYSIVHHEMGHALFFDSGYQSFVPGTGTSGNGTTWGTLTSPAIRSYFSGDLPIDFRNHFCKITNSGAIDPASGFGAFGNEYADDGTMPRARWLITKLDLLAAQAVGYPLRSALVELQQLGVADPGVLQAKVGMPVTFTFAATGGVPAYDWSVSAGALPAGVSLNRLSGALEGAPQSTGTSSFSVRVEDSLGDSVERSVSIVAQ